MGLVRSWIVMGIVLCVSGVAHAAPNKAHLGDLRGVGKVKFANSCSAKVQARFQRAVALLHSFFYDEAKRIFDEVAKADPKCAMAHWGVAMTYYHPLWAPPTPAEIKAGQEAVKKATAIGAKTDRERDYIAAAAAFYFGKDGSAAGGTPTCHGANIPFGGRTKAFFEAMDKLRQKYPKDVEAQIFYALALIATAPPADRTLSQQMKAAQMLEAIYKKQPKHPGVIHYLIHAYDYPGVATKGLTAARNYAKLAPWVAHVLHMPSHIFTRLGMWKESVESNLASAAAARAYAEKHHPGANAADELHALDYLAYAHLQMGQDKKALEIHEKLMAMTKTHPWNPGSAYPSGSIPARYTLERKKFAEAAKLVAPKTGPLDRFPYAAAHLEFARAVGAARSGDLKSAKMALERLTMLRAKITAPPLKFFGENTESQRKGAAAWIAHAEGRSDEAVRLLREAADSEDRLGPHPISPGSILPAREQLGDLFMELKQPQAALTEYERSLKLYPGRFNSLYGAGRAAELVGRKALAKQYYKDLVAMTRSADTMRPEIEHARRFIAK